MEIKKLTQEEITILKEIQDQNFNLIEQFGQVEMQIQILELQKNNLKQTLSSLKSKEIEIGNQLQTKYGNGKINLETGELITE
jgi:chaperonin cofactor prefoldin